MDLMSRAAVYAGLIHGLFHPYGVWNNPSAVWIISTENVKNPICLISKPLFTFLPVADFSQLRDHFRSILKEKEGGIKSLSVSNSLFRFIGSNTFISSFNYDFNCVYVTPVQLRLEISA